MGSQIGMSYLPRVVLIPVIPILVCVVIKRVSKCFIVHGTANCKMFQILREG